MRYFTLSTSYTQCKNKLQEKLRKIADDNSNTIIETDYELFIFKNKMQEAVEEANNQFSKCKPERFDYWDPSSHDNYQIIRLGSNADLKIYHAKN